MGGVAVPACTPPQATSDSASRQAATAGPTKAGRFDMGYLGMCSGFGRGPRPSVGSGEYSAGVG